MTKKTPAKKTKRTRAVAKKTQPKAVATKKSFWTRDQVALITRTVAKGASIDELGLFFNIAKRAKLDPFLRQIHLIPRKVKQPNGSYATVRTPQVGIDGYLAIAERTKQLAGIEDAIFDDGKKYEPGKEPANPSKATITVYRMVNGERVPFTASARWKEYFPGEKMGFMWKKMPYGQLSKCALALALRRAFPTDLSGLYVEEEMGKVGEPVNIPDPKTDNSIKKPKTAVKTTKTVKTVKPMPKPKKPQNKAIEGEIVQEKSYFCAGCDVPISKTDFELSSKLSKDGKPYCAECLKQYRK